MMPRTRNTASWSPMMSALARLCASESVSTRTCAKMAGAIGAAAGAVGGTGGRGPWRTALVSRPEGMMELMPTGKQAVSQRARREHRNSSKKRQVIATSTATVRTF
jgi:hypothetical protein